MLERIVVYAIDSMCKNSLFYGNRALVAKNIDNAIKVVRIPHPIVGDGNAPSNIHKKVRCCFERKRCT